MKRITVIILGIIAVMTVNCSKQNIQGGAETSQEPWVNDTTLPVPIELGAGDNTRIESKAAVLPGNLNDTHFGIFAIDVSQTWADGSDNVLFQNVEGLYNDGTIEFVDGKKYYPMLTQYNYTFYGYHPFIEGTWNGETFNSDITLGNYDILWAKAEAADVTNPDESSETIKGFNASYARNVRKWYPGTYAQYQPSMNFKHLTTALYFVAKAEDATAEKSLADGGVTIDALSVSGVPTGARLCIADRAGTAEGTLTATTNSGTLNMYKDTSYENLGVAPITAGARIGDGLFMLPQASEGVTLNFTISAPDGATVRRTGLTLPAPANGLFEAGKYYTYNIIIKSLEEIVIKATVEDWMNGFTEEETDTIVDNIG